MQGPCTTSREGHWACRELDSHQTPLSRNSPVCIWQRFPLLHPDPPPTNTHSSLHRSLASEYLTTQMDPGLLHELGEGREGGSVEALGPRRAAAIATAPDYLAMTHQAQAVSSAVMVRRSGPELDVDDGVQWSDCCLQWAGLVCMMTFAGERNGSAGVLAHETGRCLHCQNPASHALPASAHPPLSVRPTAVHRSCADWWKAGRSLHGRAWRRRPGWWRTSPA